ncbi:MAG: 50S ribosomal protein L23 [Candidatus Omnitrophica bacterium]|nr:50S ribosomal protein L23 [Candidatus Omnitrophota bacterium]
MLYPSDIIKALLRTEKANIYEPEGRYLFLVNKNANKIQIRKAVEELYKVKVKAVNTYISRGKMKRVRYQPGKTPDSKKAVVTLQEGQKIETST